jgi:class 3 adenylate cyclase
VDDSSRGPPTAAALPCGSCGTELPPNSKFCIKCGAPVRPAATAAEYKQVTVLFADVVHSMDIAAAVELERLREIMTEVVERSASVVQRYGGTVEYTGDGVMAIFGAPVALEDHAFRGCLAALAIQEEANRLAAEVQRRDGVALRLRVGLNSGRVIAGEIGSGSLGYAAIGEQVGLAQRMESVAPPAGVMLSESTARLVEHTVMLGGPEWVRIKGADEPVRARRLVAISPRDGVVGRAEASLVGRRWEMAALDAMVDRTIGGRGGVVNVVGPPGIGKSRVAREAAALAAGRGVEVFWAFCESHARDISFGVVRRLLRATTGIADLEGQAARAQVRQQIPDAYVEDLLLLDDLLGIADPDMPLPAIDPDARRRRLTALINAVSLARTEPALFIIEDAQWIDSVSESMLADLITVMPRTPSMVLITARPEYQGALTRLHGAQTIALAPLGDSDTAALLGELLGSDRSVGELAAIVADRAAGNPFFAEEMVRELAQRGVLTGERGGYVCDTNAAEVTVPATVTAAIEARIDRLDSGAKQTLNAASVIGARFDAELLAALGIDPVFDELLSAELIDQVRFTPSAEYVFHHPLIRAVAYESQLKSDRGELHRRVAAAIEAREPESVDEKAALVADHLEAAGDLRAAFEWHMRAGNWLTHRDIAGARMSWERARQVADRLPADDAERMTMRITPRTLLCATIWRVGGSLDDTGFEELHELATAADDKRSLAIGMTGLVQLMQFYGKYTEASQLASRHVELLDSIGDPELTVGLLITPVIVKWAVGEVTEAMKLSQRAIDASGGDPTMGDLMVGSPLALALVMRASARCCLGIPGWREDFDNAIALARRIDKFTFGAVVMFKYIATQSGALLPDDDALRDTAEALEIARQFGDDFSLTNAEFTRGLILVRHENADRNLGFELLDRARRVALQHRNLIVAAWCVDIDLAAEKNRIGDYDGAIDLCSAALDNEIRCGEMTNRGWCTSVLVEALLNRGRDTDLDEAQNAVDNLAAMANEPGYVYNELPLLRLNAMLAKARGDEDRYRDFREQYRARAESCGFEGHIAMAHAMV